MSELSDNVFAGSFDFKKFSESFLVYIPFGIDGVEIVNDKFLSKDASKKI